MASTSNVTLVAEARPLGAGEQKNVAEGVVGTHAQLRSGVVEGTVSAVVDGEIWLAVMC